jgi:hypothetical protein
MTRDWQRSEGPASDVLGTHQCLFPARVNKHGYARRVKLLPELSSGGQVTSELHSTFPLGLIGSHIGGSICRDAHQGFMVF